MVAESATRHVVVVAGPNGAGKSTAAPALLNDALAVKEFVNADAIAAGLSAFRPESVAIAAGRIMLERMRSLASAGDNFAFETTLASRSFAPWLKTLRSSGYRVHLLFLWLRAPELAIQRVAERVRLGGHDIPEAVIRRRYTAGLKIFLALTCRSQIAGSCWTILNPPGQCGLPQGRTGQSVSSAVVTSGRC